MSNEKKNKDDKNNNKGNNNEKKNKDDLPKVISSKEERERLLEQPNKNTPTGYRNYCMMRLMLDCGLRISEVTDLKINRINFYSNQIEIKDAKGSKDRNVWIVQDTLDEIQEWLDWRGDLIKEGRIDKPREKWVFITFNGTQVKHSYMRRTVKKYAKEAELKNWKEISPHTLRHTFATKLYKKCNNLKKVQKALGHSDSDTTEIYTHIVDEDLKKDMMDIRD